MTKFMRKPKALLICLLLASMSSINAIEGVYEVIIRKQQEKQASRWTLADWLMTKQKMALMDQWLALNSSSTWFEFFIESSGVELEGRSSQDSLAYNKHAYRHQGAMYIRAFGLQGGVDKFSGFQDSSFYQANLILLGSSAQSTNIQVHFGKRDVSIDGIDFGPTYWGVSSTLYLFPFLGGLYEYRSYGDDTQGTAAFLEGSRQEYGGFLDLWFFRLKGTYFKERASLRSSSNINYDQRISGWWFGGQIFF